MIARQIVAFVIFATAAPAFAANPAAKMNGVQLTPLAASPVAAGAAGISADASSFPRWDDTVARRFMLFSASLGTAGQCLISGGSAPATWGSCGGSAAIGNWVFSGNNVDLPATGTMGMALTNATAMSVGNPTFGNFSVTGSRILLTQRALSTGTGSSALAIIGGAHTALTASTENFDINFSLARVVQFSTGALSIQRAAVFQAPTYAFTGASTITTAATLAITGAPVAGTNATITNPYALWLQGGNLGMAAGGTIVSAGTLNHTSQVADSASAVGYSFDETTACATDGCVAFRVRSAAADWMTIGRTSAARKFTFFGDTDSTGSGPVLVKSTAASAGLTLDATTAGGRIYQQYSTTAGLYVLADLTAGLNRWQMDSTGALSPYADNSYDLGIASTNRVRVVNSVRTDALRYTSSPQTQAFSATPTINCTNGGMVHFGPVTGNITSVTLTAGLGGERCTIIFQKDATAGAYTISNFVNASWSANQTFTTNTSSRVIWNFIYDTAATGGAVWVETSVDKY